MRPIYINYLNGESFTALPQGRGKKYCLKAARTQGLCVLSLNCCFRRGVEVLSIILSKKKKDMPCGASIIVQRASNRTSKTLLPEINIVSSLTLPLRFEKVPVCDEQRSDSPWEQLRERINILLRTMSQCHVARFTLHIGSLCGMCAAWDSRQGMTDLWQHQGQCQTSWKMNTGGCLK